MMGNLVGPGDQTGNERATETNLRTRRTPVRLAFANHMNRFVTGDGAPRTPERAEMLARVDPTLDRPVTLFQDVIEILHGAVSAVVGQIACGLEPGNGGRGRRG